MKKQNRNTPVFVLLLGLIALTLISWNNYEDKITKCQKAGVKIESEKILNYFISRLNGEDSSYSGKKKLKIKSIDNVTAQIWRQWKEANIEFNEQKLIELSPLAMAKVGCWDIPSSLEPKAKMPYYFGSKGDRPEDGYPFYLYLHGSGPKDGEWRTGLALGNKFKDTPSVYFIPQIPNTGSYYRWWQKGKLYCWERLLRQTLVSDQINPNAIFFFGISEGGYGSQRLASYYADYLAGAGPMAGGEPLRNAPVENYYNLAFSFLTGEYDSHFGRSELTMITKEEIAKMQHKHPDGYKHRIELIKGMGHSIDYSGTTSWLKENRRNPHPKSFNWENFEMDGIYRDGFYNLHVVERSNSDNSSRTYYTQRIEGNKVILTVDLVKYDVTEKNKWGIETRYKKSYERAKSGKLILYLNNELVDLSKNIEVILNDKTVFKGKLNLDVKHIVNSCASFFDSERLYPAAIELTID